MAGRMGWIVAGGLVATLGGIAACSTAPESGAQPDAASASDRAPRQPVPNPERNAYFGDLHVHTRWSVDAYGAGGNTLDGPDVAYRYGRGDAITAPDGRVRGQLRVPLDFMAVTDHDIWLGEVQICEDPNDPAYDTPVCRTLRTPSLGNLYGTYYFRRPGDPLSNRYPPDICGGSLPGPGNKCYEQARHMWPEVQKNADAFYEPGRFTTFPGYEFTANVNDAHLHRVVIFRGEQIPDWGGSAVEMENRPERLWEWLESACTLPCQVIAIPHNTNWSDGISLATQNSDGSPFTKEILARRVAAEPLIEVFQGKGGSECYLGLGTVDEECTFELYYPACQPGQTTGCSYASDYVRNALKTGLTVEGEYGINPFKYGLIASTDDHKSMPGSVDEKGWAGSPRGTMDRPSPGGLRGGTADNGGGLVGVWAEANTREAIFDALKRRETFGTSGPRMRVRFFGGWDFGPDLASAQTLVRDAYAHGVPMGADLPTRPSEGGAPQFLVWALKDPAATNLQKVQIVKGWARGAETFEQVFDVACADGVAPDADTHRCADNGATVDLASCTPTVGRGAAELRATWTDPGFDPGLRAFYYVRVLENPTCRWTTWRAVEAGTPPPDTAPPVIKERAWSSPIWYTPPGQ